MIEIFIHICIYYENIDQIVRADFDFLSQKLTFVQNIYNER